MPSSDYTSAVGGGLRLKGAKDAGIDKKKKKKKRPATDTSRDVDTPPTESRDGEEASERRITKRVGSEEASGNTERVSERTEKTEAEKKHEETRRKRVGHDMMKGVFADANKW